MKFRQISSTVFVVILSYLCSAQKALLGEVENPDASKYKPLHVELEGKNKYSAPVHFAHVIIIDGRADKSKMGVTRAGDKPENRRIVFAKDFTSYLEEKINKLCSHSSVAADTVIYIINNAWLYQTLSRGSFLKQQALGISNDWNSNCFLNIDCYLARNSNYKLICNIDTVVTSRGWLPNQCNHILSEAFSGAISFSDSIFANKLYSNTEIDQERFKNLLLTRLDHPILKAEKFSKGFYNSYEDFLNNNIYSAEPEVYYKENKRHVKSKTVPDSVIRNVWGFCDGENFFINIEGAFFKLIRSGNTFDLMGPQVIEYRTTLFNKTVSAAATYAFITKPFVNPSAFLEPGHQTVETFKFYQLNIKDGVFR